MIQALVYQIHDDVHDQFPSKFGKYNSFLNARFCVTISKTIIGKE